ncbi:MAG: NAD(P)/FAD-dependent oxidoreductase [Bacteroidales bacterium]|nr:NAD(P)/FAD-dependent oxidoreductase [Bacteroidales bacterium]
MKEYDVVIIGSGLSGLSCGVMLAKEGLSVCVLEQHSVCGGCLQSFRRDGQTFDTGFHYIGSMAEGQLMHQYFKYFGIADRVRTIALDADGYETLNIGGREYTIPIGRQRFADRLSEYFPSQREGIQQFTNRVFEVKDSIGVGLLRQGIISLDGARLNMSVSAAQTIDNCVTDSALRGVLAGSSLLYGGERATSNFYSYSMVVGSNIEGASKILGGTQTVADAMADQIQRADGEVLTRARVSRIAVADGQVSHVEVADREPVRARYYISSLYPAHTFNMLDRTPAIKKVYINRLNELKNTYGVFSTYIKLKPNKLPYRNTNIYIHSDANTWASPEKRTPTMLFCPTPSADMRWTDVATLLIPMYHSEFAEWDGSSLGERPQSYEEFKQRTAQWCIDLYERHYPGFRECIDKVYTSSPLTFRDYTSTPDGTAYGVMKNYANPLPTMFSVRTKIPNLLLTGQSLFVHGAIGVTVTSTLACAEILGAEYLARKIGNA